VSHPTARHQKPSQPSPARHDPYDEGLYDHGPYRAAVYDGVRHDDGGYEEASYDRASFGQAWRERASFGQAWRERAFFDHAWHERASFDQAPYEEVRYDQTQYDEAFYDDGAYQEAPYGQAFYDQAPSGQGPYEEAPYEEAPYEEAPYEEAPYEEAPYEDSEYEDSEYDEALNDEAPHGKYDGPAPSRRKPGAHRHSRPPRTRHKPVRIAAALAGSTLLVAAAAPAAAHWWHRPATHPDALDQASLPTAPGAAAGTQNSTPSAAAENALDQWAQVPIGKHVAAEAKVAQRARKPAVKQSAPQPSHSPQPSPPPVTPTAAYQNPLRAVSDLVLERVDMGVDFGGAGPVYALGDGVITNATSDSSGWPGGGWITYQLTDGPDDGLMVYVAEDVTPTVQVGQKVTSSTVIANMFNGGDGIETGWATSDGSTAESQMAAAGGIGGNGPFPTVVGLSFEAVLESVGVPAAPNANEPGNGLLPAGYPALAI
jgi:hypothetical protein